MSAEPAPDLLSTAQAAAMLGVKPESVYAYVSRGLLPRVDIPGRRGSWFRPDQVEALQRRGSRPVHTGLAERIRTRVTLLEDDHQYYRGHDVCELADTRTFEQVCALLWDRPIVRIVVPRDGALVAAGLSEAGRPIDVIRIALSEHVASLQVRGDVHHDAVQEAGALIGTAVAALPLRGRPLGPRRRGADHVVAALWPRLTAQRATVPALAAVRTALIVLADHELAASTTAARVAASGRADIGAVLLAALGAMDSPLHGGAPGAARGMFREALHDPAGVISMHLAQEQRPVGFGHLVYRHRDPRAVQLLAAVRELPDVDPVVPEVAGRLVREWGDRRGWFPNSDFALAVLAEATGMRTGAGEAIFTIARLAGWTAHALEEYQEPPMRFRLSGVYVGPRPGDR